MFGVYEILAVIGILIFFLYYKFTANFDFWRKRNVRGPKPIVFFGNFKNMILLKEHFGKILDFYYKKYKNEPVFGVFAQTIPFLVVKDPDLISTVLIKEFNTFSDRNLKPQDCDPLSAHLVFLETKRWRPLRKRLTPVFTGGKLKEMFYLLTECGEYFEKYLKKVTAVPGSIEVRELTAKFTTDAIAVCAFGLNVKSLQDGKSEFLRIGERFFETTFLNTLKNSLRYWSPTLLAWLYPFLFHRELERFFIGLMKETIEYRKKNNYRRNDFVDLLMDIRDNPEKINNIEFTDSLLTSQAFVFFAAGYETSSTTISNALLELALNQDIQNKVRKEIIEELEKTGGIPTYDNINNMKYLDKVFKETLRKYPPITTLVRKSMKEFTFDDLKLTIPARTNVFIPVYSIHHDENWYPEPSKFDPERFDAENEKSRHPMFYLPFGDGPRNCIGIRFGTFQTKLGIIIVIKNYVVQVDKNMKIPYKMDPKCLVNTPTDGILLNFKKYSCDP